MRRVVVTGGCGYIGSHVARAFKQVGDEVYIIDQVKRDHTLKDMDGWFIGDFASEGSLSTIIDIRPDVIVHCAGTSLVGPSMDNPSEYWHNNVTRLIKLLDIVAGMPKRPLMLFSSSASVYGDPEELPIPESHKIDPISAYGNTKATAERIFRDYHLAYAIQSVCFRFFNAAGAEPINHDLGQEPGATHIIARVLEAAIEQKTFKMYGSDYPTADGSCVRDYIHVWDLAQAHIFAADKATGVTGWVGAQCVNLGTGQGISNREIVNYAREHYNLPAPVIMPRRLGDPAKLVAHCKFARNWLGWIPKHSDLASVMDSAYKWYTK